MKETDWAKQVAKKLDVNLPKHKVEAGKRLIYANEIKTYEQGSPIYNKMLYETDILIFDNDNEGWTPRVVIETKINAITTHDVITYSQKAASHKYVHPFLRYGIFIGNRGSNPLPGRLFRHGAHFDFMISWQKFNPKDYEWEAFLQLVKKEISASKKLEDMMFNNRKKDRKKYFVLHKPLITKIMK